MPWRTTPCTTRSAFGIKKNVTATSVPRIRRAEFVSAALRQQSGVHLAVESCSIQPRWPHARTQIPGDAVDKVSIDRGHHRVGAQAGGAARLAPSATPGAKKSDEQSSGRSDSRPKDCRFYRGAQQGSAGRAINVTAAQPNNVVYSTRAPFIGRRGATAGRQAAINCGHGRRSAHIRRNAETRLPCVKTGSEQARKNLLFDHLVGAGEQDGWNSEAERLRGL
jgi:hypothetical protein